MKSVYRYALYYTEVRCLSCGRMLKRVYNFRSGIELFLELEVKHFPSSALWSRLDVTATRE